MGECLYTVLRFRAIQDMLAQHRGSRSRSSMEGAMQQEAESEAAGPSVLPSSTELFYFYGQTMEQCGKYTTGEPMKKLGKVFAKWLKVYSGTSRSDELVKWSKRSDADLVDEVLLAGLKRQVHSGFLDSDSSLIG